MNSKNAFRFVGLCIVICCILLSCNNVVRVDDSQKITIKESDLKKGTNYLGIKTCDEGTTLAKKHLETGQLRYIFGGFGSRQPLAKNLQEMYGIEIIAMEGVLGLPNDCYNKVMYIEIQKQFGEDAFNKAME